METSGIHGQWYICTLIDEHSRFTILRTLSSKAEAADALLDMITTMETQTGWKAKSPKTDNGGEYQGTALLGYLWMKGISLKETVAYHSQTNAIAEQTNRTLVTMARTALLHAKLPKYLWPEAVAHSAYTKNRTPHQTLDSRSPLELFLHKADVRQQRSKFRAFGEPVWIHLPHTIGKLTARSVEGYIIGYTSSSGIYHVYSKDKRVTTTKEPRYRSLNSQFNPIDMDHTMDQNDFQREDTSQDEEKPKYIVESEPIGNIPESETEPKATEQMEAISTRW